LPHNAFIDLADMQIMSKRISVTDVFRVLADVKTQSLLNSIAIGYDPNSQILITNLGLTTRQYYDRIRRLTDAGLIRRDKGRYSLSSFGNIIIRLQKMAERTVSSYWKLEAIDRIRSSGNSNLAEVDYLKLIDILLNDVEIKDIYLQENVSLNVGDKSLGELNLVASRL
jgi:hypothetical protein